MFYLCNLRAQPDNSKLTMKDFLIKHKHNDHTFNAWKHKYHIQPKHRLWDEKIGERTPFLDWWEEELETQGANVVGMLRAIGMNKAIESFPHWKEMARTEGVIKPEQIEQKNYIIPVDLSRYDDYTDIDIERAKKRLMDSLRGVEDSGRVGMAPDIAERSESTTDRVDEVQEGPVVLSNSLGQDN